MTEAFQLPWTMKCFAPQGLDGSNHWATPSRVGQEIENSPPEREHSFAIKIPALQNVIQECIEEAKTAMKYDEKTRISTITRTHLNSFPITWTQIFYFTKCPWSCKTYSRNSLMHPKALFCRSYSHYLFLQSAWLNYRKLLIYHSEWGDQLKLVLFVFPPSSLMFQ